MNVVIPDWPLLNSTLEIREADEGAIVEDASEGRIHYVNRSGAFVLSLCDGQTDIESIARQVQSQFSLAEMPIYLIREILREFVAGHIVLAGSGPQC